MLLSLCSLVVVALSAVSFTILMGSLYGGFLGIILAALQGGRPRFKDLFRHIRRFVPLYLAVWFAIILTFAGLIILVVPGVFFGTSCFYLLILAADRGIGFDEAFVESRKAVRKYGFWKHLFLASVALGIPVASILLARKASLAPFDAKSLLIPVLLQPFALGVLVSAYQQTLKTEEEAKRRYEKEYEYMRDELETARDMQMNLLPKESPRMADYTIDGICLTANHVGGDYFAYRFLDGGARLAVVVADVSGKAMVAAVKALRFNEMLRYELEGRSDPVEVLSGLQKSLEGQIEPAAFITCCMAVLEVDSGAVETANAGHCHPLCYSRKNGRVSPLRINGFALGMPRSILAEAPYERARIVLSPGDALMIFTDGITDAEDAGGEFFGRHRLEQLFENFARRPTASEIVAGVIERMKEFSSGSVQTDDYSLVVLKRNETRGPVRAITVQSTEAEPEG